MSKSKAKKHYGTVAFSICPAYSKNITDKIPDVTCKRCLAMLGMSGLLPESTFDVLVLATGPMFINTIKVVRQLSSEFGLREAKDFCDRVRDKGEQILLADVTRERAEHAEKLLKEQGATVLVIKHSAEAAIKADKRIRDILRQILRDLPENRDWLDPALEREAKELLGITDA
jgi:ribosomal protein L7/L12